MKIIEKVLKSKLASLGYDVESISNQLSQMDFEIIDNQIGLESEASNYINIKKYTEPTVEISRMLVNYNKYYIQNIIVSGKVDFSTSMTSINTVFPVVNYNLFDNICIVATTVALNVEILIYNPTENVKMQYLNETYEDLVAEERNKIAREYYEAFIENGRVPENKVKSILALLLSEHIIDEITITDDNPKIKMYDNIDAYAENITEYRIKYINRKTNRVELAYRPTYIKRLGANVSAGLISNDPYIKLENLSARANFPLNTISCYWTNSSKNKKGEVAIYIATKRYQDFSTYKEYCENNTKKYDEIVNSLMMQFQREVGRDVNRQYVETVLKTLNPELVCPSMDIIRDCMNNPADPIEPIKYKYKAICIPEDFEDKLYISIEDNIGKRYKYKLTENILSDLTRIGNKLEYTNEDGSIVRKQSIADFNVNSSTAIIRRETLIDATKIPGLLGYIYEDVEYIGTDMLPVPSIEVDFYFPQYEKSDILMFNGTNFTTDINAISSAKKFNSIDDGNLAEALPGTTYATVRYVNSKGEILKENKITNLFPGTPYIPEIIPIINDVEGREWICSTTQYPSTIINVIPDYNIIEIKYAEKYSKVSITFLNRDGKKICDDVIETVQAGTTYDINKKMQYTDEQNNDWKLVTSRPQKLLVKDDESKNNLILVYDLEKEPVTVKYMDSNGENIIEPKVTEVQIGKIYTLHVDRIMLDKNGIGWVYNGPNPITHVVEDEKENLIEIKFEEYKLPVTVKYQSQDGISILNDCVEYIQVGKKYIPKADDEVVDFKLKMWKYKEGLNNDFIVSKDEKVNTIKIVYEPILATVSIQMINEAGNKILNPIQKRCQIGEEFSSIYLNEVTDNYGKMWIKKEDPESLVVSKNEVENNIIIKYQPLIAKIMVKFFDDERNELIPSKNYEKQAGTLFKPNVIENLESPDGRKWCIDSNKVKEITVKKNDEENIVSIFYNKELTDVTLEFMDAYGKKLRDVVTVKAQIGSIFNEKSFNKIEDYEGGKWMIENTEPKKMIVKNSSNNFKLYYGEVKAIVVVKHINVKTNKTILDDVIAKVKLGGVFIPNIQEKVFDTDKCLWKFIGDKNISIVVKENEQENIVLLQYDEALAQVHVKYQDLFNNRLRDDITYNLQIGKDIDYKKMDKFIDVNGMGWVIESSKTSNTKVLEKDNEVINYYNPLKVDVKVKYLNDKEEEICESNTEKMQVGRTFKPSYENRIKDIEGRIWQYKKISAEEIKVSEKGNVINVLYSPVLVNVIERFLSKSGEEIKEDLKKQLQVGCPIEFNPENILIDNENKKWNFVKIDRSSIVVKEDENANIVNEFYEPRVAEVIIKLYDYNNNELIEPKKHLIQVGSVYKAEIPPKYIDSKTKLGWVLPAKINDTIKVDEDVAKNIIPIKYDKYMVTVKDRIVDIKENIILPDHERLLQVGTIYEPKIEENVKDEEGKEWMFDGKHENRFLSENKLSIMVSEDIEKNIVYLKYKPLLANVTIKYQDNLGNIIAQHEEVEAQIGSNFTPEIKEVIKDHKKNKWAYNPNSKSSIHVSRDENKNVIILSYEEEKAPIIYKFQDEFNNRLKSPKKKLAQIGSICTPEIDNVIEDEHGRVWEYKTSSVDKIEVKDTEQDNVVILTYAPLCVNVELDLKNKKGELISKVNDKAQLGSIFKPNVDETIFDENSMMYRLVKCNPTELLIKEVPIGSEEEINIFEVIYEPVYSNVVIVYQDIDGNKLKDDEIIQLQVGTKYTPKFIQYVNDRKGIQWENISKEIDTIRVMENQKENVIKMTYELAKAEVLVRYKNLDGNTIIESKRYMENIGVEFVPEVENVITDSKNRKWIYMSADPVKITVGSINNIITMTYQEKKVPVVIKYETVDGKKLREDVTVNVQEGIQFIPKKNFAIIYDENEIWRYLEFRPSSLLVTDKIAENVIIQVYDNKTETINQKNKLVNPFANTLQEDEKVNDIEKNVPSVNSNNLFTEKIIDKDKQEPKIENKDTNEIIFIEPNLIELSKNILLEENEKATIIKLNKINRDIIEELNNFKSSFDFNIQEQILRNIDNHMLEEKDIIEKELENMILEDKTGKKFLKILEAIVSLDNDYKKMQERKVVLLTDYFINSEISVIEQATYICERGKNDKELLIMQAKINDARKNKDELQKIYVDLIYEKAMLDSYYKTRTKSKDEYFVNDAERASVGSEVVIMVTNMLPKQAFNLLQKNNLNLLQQNELDAIINLLTVQQRGTLEKLISEVRDGKMKKEMIKKLKDIR